MEKPMIYSKIAAIMKDVPAIGKTQRNSQQGYAYRGIDDVMNGLQNILPKYGVFYVPEVLESQREERTTAKGGTLIYSVLKVKYTFYAEDGSSVSAVVQSEGMDSADKSSNKAMSAACKYALFQVFNIPTVEMIDPDATTPEPSKPAAKKTVEFPGNEAFLKRFTLPEGFSTNMSLDAAASICDSHGVKYGDKTLEELYQMLDTMLKQMERNHLNEAQKELLNTKITAVYMLFDAAKKQGSF